METSFRGTFVIQWSQTKVDGEHFAPVSELLPDRPWMWSGEALRVDGPGNILPLGASSAELEIRKRAALTVRKFLGERRQGITNPSPVVQQDPLFGKNFVVTNGRKTWEVFVLSVGQGKKPLLMFFGQIPPRETKLWVVRHNLGETLLAEAEETPKGVICFTPGTMIDTPHGKRDIANLVEGDLIQTKDNGVSPILWLGKKRVSGARLKAMPDLVPIRLRAGALDKDVPDAGLLVSPDHRMVLRGPKARSLFNADEVLVTARDLINDHSIIRDHSANSVSYIHMMLPRHEVVFANGVATESFHPASAAMSSLADLEQQRLFDRLPDLSGNPQSYGGFARRLLKASEAAILRMDA